jgi:hypothetical protein
MPPAVSKPEWRVDSRVTLSALAAQVRRNGAKPTARGHVNSGHTGGIAQGFIGSGADEQAADDRVTGATGGDQGGIAGTIL